MKRSEWITTGPATIERCRELLAVGGAAPITIRWRRADRTGKGGGWEPAFYTETVALVGVTVSGKRLRVRNFYRTPSGPVVSGPVYIADPKKCSFAEWQEP